MLIFCFLSRSMSSKISNVYLGGLKHIFLKPTHSLLHSKSKMFKTLLFVFLIISNNNTISRISIVITYCLIINNNVPSNIVNAVGIRLLSLVKFGWFLFYILIKSYFMACNTHKNGDGHCVWIN